MYGFSLQIWSNTIELLKQEQENNQFMLPIVPNSLQNKKGKELYKNYKSKVSIKMN